MIHYELHVKFVAEKIKKYNCYTTFFSKIVQVTANIVFIPGLNAISVNLSPFAFPELTPGLISRCNPNMFLTPGDDENEKKS